jgi:hypothetical protein
MHTAPEGALAKRAEQTVFGSKRRRQLLLCAVFAAAMALPAGRVLAQDLSPIMPKFSLQGDPKRPLTPEEQERQKRIDSEYRAATKKIPDQKPVDPWADVRQSPAATGQKASASAQQKKQPPQ